MLGARKLPLSPCRQAVINGKRHNFRESKVERLWQEFLRFPIACNAAAHPPHSVPVLKRYRHLSMVLFTAILICSSALFSIPFSQLSPFLTAKVNVVFRMPSSGSVHYKNLHPYRVVFKAPLYGENLSLYALQHLLKLCKRRTKPTEVIE